ncbi:WASH complex subunit 3 [Anopheles maculipalpis]|uniref:WASH complex subunit 3 n=1 Tax=Anopheles maculipalpis TaxID=1496333 RepID=UPI0021598A62|nr:WASH complex subunit 3 [Anopheles maculipalpis]
MDTLDTVQKHELSFQLPPTNQKRMVAFINHFIVSTVTFLNKFASDCETRFVAYEQKIQNLEASLMIVEAKLASIDVLKQHPDNSSVAIEDNKRTSEPSPATEQQTAVQLVEEKESQPEEKTQPNPSAPEKDPKYEPYFKMLHFGVPLGAVKNKIASEGLDPNYIDKFL